MQYFIKAKVCEAQKNYLGAIVALRSAADLDTTSPTIYTQLALDYRQIGDERMAMLFAREGLELDPGRTQLRRLLIQLLERSGNHAAAVEELEELLRREPDNWRHYRHLAYLYLETEQAERITPLFKRVLERDDAPVEVRIDIASVFSRIGQHARAERIYIQILEEHPDVEDAWLGLAELHLSQGKREQAISCYRQAAQMLTESSAVFYYLARLLVTPHDLEEILETEDPRFLYRLGLAFSEAGAYDQAAVVFQHIVGLQPTNVEGWLDLARYYIYMKDYDQAGGILAQAAGAMPDSSSIYLFWGTAMEQAGRFAEAIDVYRRGLQHLPEERPLYLYWGIALEQQERWEEAIDVYRQALQLEPPDPELHVRWGIVLAQQEKWEQAMAQYQQAVALDSLRTDALLHWGIALEQQERWEEAIEKLSRAAELDEADPHVLFYLGACFEQASRQLDDEGYFARAVEAFERLLELDPDDAYTLNYLGYMYADKGVNLEEAVALLSKAVALEPDNSAFLDSMGWAYFRLGELDQAEGYLNKALQALEEEYEAEEKAVIFDHAGDIAQALGKTSQAREHWQKVLQLTPDNEAVKHKLSP